jgi:hypothetical protein
MALRRQRRRTIWEELDLKPGSYIAICCIFDPRTRRAHVVTVEA